MKHIRIWILFTTLTLILPPNGAHAQTWIGGSGVWSNANNWCGGVPNGGDVLIGACKSNPPSTVTEDIWGRAGNLTIDNSANSLTVIYPNRLTLSGSSISNAGTLALSGNNMPNQGAQMQLTGTTVTLSGSGIFLMNDAPNLVLGGNSTTLVNQQTIRGAGTLGAEGFFNLNNQSLVDAQGANPLNIQNNFGSVLNTGTIQASNGGTLQFLLGGNPGTLNNAGGTVKALDGSTVRLLSNTFINGGTLTTAGSGLIHGVNGGLSNLTNSGLFQVGGIAGFGTAVIHLGGTITNTRTIRIGSPAWGDDATGVDGSVTLTGGGTVNFDNSAEQMIGTNNTGNTLTNSNNTISGTGIMGGGNGLTLTNSGTVDANSSSGPLVLALSVTNSSTMQASNGGELRTQGDINNAGGTIQALDKSKVTLVSNTITGGTLATSGSGVIQTAPTQPLLDGVANTGLLSVASGDQVALKDTITNSGIISLDDPGNVVISGAVTLAGHGEVALSNNANNFISGQGSSPSLSNDGNLIDGAGAIAVDLTNQLSGTVLAHFSNPLNLQGPTVTNLGTFQANAGSTLAILQGATFTNFSSNKLTSGTYVVAGTFEFPGANIVTNAAEIQLTNRAWQVLNSDNNTNALANLAANTARGSLTLSMGARLTTSSPFTNAGNTTVGRGTTKFTVGGTYTQTSGTTRVDGSLVASAFALNGGTLEGNSGTRAGVIAPVTSSGTVIAGDSQRRPGVLAVSAYTQTASGVLNVQIAASPGNTCSGAGRNYSQLSVGNGMVLHGTLIINFLNHPVLHSGDCFNIVTGQTLSGHFDHVRKIGSNQNIAVKYPPTGVQLVVP